MRIFITGGAGFVGSHLALNFKNASRKNHVLVFDNLKRRGSELNIPRLKSAGVEFIHGDIRNPTDLDLVSGPFDLFIEASAEPSVLAGYRTGESSHYALQTNLFGTAHCLEWARGRVGRLIFLSTSRVYSLQALRTLDLSLKEHRLVPTTKTLNQSSGLTENGITEDFSTNGGRSLYGTTKLASELLVQEYAASFGVPALVNRCGVICGPWQWGKVDQGVFTLWAARHVFGGPLSYTGFGGQGHQVRDLLHPEDLYRFIIKQLDYPGRWDGRPFNVGGGLDTSTSLKELTLLLQDLTGRHLEISSQPESTPVDIPWYVTDATLAQKSFQWQPQHSVKSIFSEILDWLKNNESILKPLFS
jgi:CDP-paratose 2-epimerase